jgi:hypothetical protein
MTRSRWMSTTRRATSLIRAMRTPHTAGLDGCAHWRDTRTPPVGAFALGGRMTDG